MTCTERNRLLAERMEVTHAYADALGYLHAGMAAEQPYYNRLYQPKPPAFGPNRRELRRKACCGARLLRHFSIERGRLLVYAQRFPIPLAVKPRFSDLSRELCIERRLLRQFIGALAERLVLLDSVLVLGNERLAFGTTHWCIKPTPFTTRRQILENSLRPLPLSRHGAHYRLRS